MNSSTPSSNDAPTSPSSPPDGDAAYEVLARKYRPRSFDDLIGHEAMVKTLENAFTAGRIAHAYILTGVRGVGKTTTARILARALNYQSSTGEDSGPQIHMIEDGLHCQAIAQSRHPDVLEMDAASRTGVGDIRELIEGVRYAPIEARYKVYIIDEVHMLSTAAFNALLKTLEEPPPHVKFIFATTEIRKLPVTVLSRCQRFDLRRIEPDVLIAHLEKIASAESVTIAQEGLAMIARAAEGSVRDALSILDQAIVQHSGDDPSNEVSVDTIRSMLGLADRSQSWTLLEHCFSGDGAKTLGGFKQQYDGGADPLVILRDLLELVHLLTRVKAAGAVAASHGPAGTADRDIANALSDKLSMNGLTRAWSLLMKGLEEVKIAPDPAAAGEMALIRLCYAADLPTPDEALKLLKSGAFNNQINPGANHAAGQNAPGENTSTASGKVEGLGASNTFESSGVAQGEAENALSGSIDRAGHRHGGNNTIQGHQDQIIPFPNRSKKPETKLPTSLGEITALAGQHKDARLRTELESFVHLVTFEAMHIVIRMSDKAPGDLPNRLMRQLKVWTGETWSVEIVSDREGADTIRDTREKEVRAHPLIARAFDLFPGAQITKIRESDSVIARPIDLNEEALDDDEIEYPQQEVKSV